MYRHGVGGYPTERPVLMHTWNTFTVHLRQRFGQRVQKIPLDAGASCPNRDGTLSRAGCTFCNAIGSGSGLGLAGMNLPAQWEHWREHFRKSNRASLFLAYLQSFSNTYGPASRLAAMLETYDHPVLFCVGAVTLNTVAAQRERFARIADFLIAPRPVLDALNDKETVHARAQSLGIPVPRQYDGVPPERYPVVIKPHCGEKFGLKAADRYAVADTPEAYAQILARMQRYDPSPIVQDKIAGPGIGVSLLLDRDGRMISALCHRRIREYPITGGPSTCCESFYDAALIDRAYRLLHSFGFTGMAMVEFKGDCLLEVNPRVWGSFPMTEAAQSPLVAHYARAAAGERVAYAAQDYRTGVRMRFLLNDTLAALHYLRAGRIGVLLRSIADLFTAKEALRCRGDNRVFWVYLKNSLFARG